jgi:GT2 family glycosyltransferase
MIPNSLIPAASFTPDLLKSNSGWLGHLPFAGWVIQELKPRIFVELGTHYGHSYFAFCQSVVEAGISTKCYAVDTWQGDEHAGRYSDEIFEKVNAHHQGHYTGFSRLLRMTFDDAVSYFADGSVELLHIDGLHTYEAVRHDFETWLPKLAPGAVVLFHDTNVRERNFGVWKLWEGLQSRYQNNLEFTHGNGLGVLQLNNTPEDKKIPWLQPSSPEKQQLINYFSALGSRQLERYELYEHKTQIVSLKREAANLHQTVSERDGQVASLNQAVADRDGLIVSLKREAANLHQTVSERDGQVASLNQAVADRDGLIIRLRSTINSIHQSTSWRVTQPLRLMGSLLKQVDTATDGQGSGFIWLAIQTKLLREQGIIARLKAMVRKIVKKVVVSSNAYVQARPALRMRLFKLAKQLDAVNYLRQLRDRMQSTSRGGVDLLRQEVVLSYPLWSANFDTPSADSIYHLDASKQHVSKISVIACFDEASEQYAEELATRLIGSVGQQWQAVFAFNQNCQSETTIQGIRRVTHGDKRISFKPSQFEIDSELVVIIQGGALPRSHALRVFADALRSRPNALIAYSDEDQFVKNSSPSNPWFKPQFSPLLASQGMLLGRMLCFRLKIGAAQSLLGELATAAKTPAEFALNFALDAGEAHVAHIPHVLYHDALFTQQLPMSLALPNTLPIVSIVIPTRDRWDLLGPCLESLKCTDWPAERMEIIVVDNGSTEALTIKMLALAEKAKLIRVIRDEMQFNWSRLNNLAARESRGELLIFLNNDTEVIDREWIKKLAVHALRPGTGAVGCKLLYPDRTVQHGGVIAGIQGVAGHAHLFLQSNEGGYRNLANITHEVSAVTGACLAVTRAKFEEVGGFNENFRVAFNDIIFCFDLHKACKRNVYVADPLLIHHESKSRGYDDTPEKLAINLTEARKTWSLHPQLMHDDPFYSPNLSLVRPYELSFATRHRAYWDDRTKRPLRVMMLSITHAIGHGVAVVVAKQAEALAQQGYEVIIAGPLGTNDFSYPGCERVEVHDPLAAATLASVRSVDLIIVHTPPFFSVARWTGAHPPVLAYDYGEPPPDWFPDAVARRAVLAEKDQALMMASAVFTISEAVAAESRTPVHGVIPLGNSHLGQWNDESSARRQRVRMERGWKDKFVIINVCRFHRGERLYKGVDTYADVRDALQTLNPELAGHTLFVLCGKGSPEDVKEMTERGLVVAANVTDEEMADLYCAADVYANFSKWEGYNLGIGQGLAMGLPTIASDIPAHRAFGIEVTNQVTDAAEWLVRTADQKKIRTPRIWDWGRPLSQLIVEVNAICENWPRKFDHSFVLTMKKQSRSGGGEMLQVKQSEQKTEAAKQ